MNPFEHTHGTGNHPSSHNIFAFCRSLRIEGQLSSRDIEQRRESHRRSHDAHPADMYSFKTLAKQVKLAHRTSIEIREV